MTASVMTMATEILLLRGGRGAERDGFLQLCGHALDIRFSVGRREFVGERSKENRTYEKAHPVTARCTCAYPTVAATPQ